MCPNVYKIYGEAVHVDNLFYTILNINYCINLAPSVCFREQIFQTHFKQHFRTSKQLLVTLFLFVYFILL